MQVQNLDPYLFIEKEKEDSESDEDEKQEN